MGVARGDGVFGAPSPIAPDHDLEAFDCGMPPLDLWLRRHAIRNEGKASRTFVVTDARGQVQAYYALASGSIALGDVPGKYRHGLPDPVPVMVLGRLAVDTRAAGRGLGGGLLKDAMRRTLSVARDAGVRALVVHAIDDEAVGFYAKYGFQAFPPETRTLLLPLEEVEAAVAT